MPSFNTIPEYIQRVKIEAAKKNFETSRKKINEVMGDIGYSDSKAFWTVFRRITGMSPMDYRNRYNRRVMLARGGLSIGVATLERGYDALILSAEVH